MAKIALLIGVSEYEPGLNPLPAAANDVEAMRRVLLRPEIGAFDRVTPLANPDLLTMQNAISTLFDNCHEDDLLLLYFSGHGVTDEFGKFYFTNRSTRKTPQGKLNKGTAVPASFVHDVMENCDSKRQVVILDCCNSGAFGEGMVARDAEGTIDFKQQLGGEGRIVLTSSSALEYSFERKGEELAIYTRYLVEGIETGAADLDRDGKISVNELHDYAKTRVSKAAPSMRPQRYILQEGEKIFLADAPVSDPKLLYRETVEQYSQDGIIRPAGRRILDRRSHFLNLTSTEAAAIEAEVLEPYRQHQRNLQEYEEALKEESKLEFPLSDRACQELKALQKELNFTDENVSAIAQKVTSSYTRPPQQPSTAEPPQRPPERPPQRPQTSAPAQVQQRESQQPLRPTFIRSQRWTRRELLFGGLGGAIAAFSSQLFKSPSSVSPPTLSSSPSTPAKFPANAVITVNLKGQETSRRSIQPKYYKEDLGNGITLEMVEIPGGKFLMGSPKSENGRSDDEGPQREVTIASFQMGKFEVTQAQWKAVAALPKVKLDLKPDPSKFKGENRPVESVSWDEAVEFCDRLSKKTGRPYRLPSEAEWEYACRAGTTTPFHFGETITTDLANYRGTDWEYQGETYPGNYGDGPKGIFREQTMDVGSFPPNAFGLYDMHGNVWEWCADPWHENYKNAPTDGRVWEVESDRENANRLLRGGSWDIIPIDCRSALRNWNRRDVRNNSLGFRLLLPAPRIP
ncbi:caspase, EACC1-associated type [Phormidesmis sp. 146-35]